MGKQEQIAIAESNLANFGTDIEFEIKKAASECEAAWDGVGQQAGLRIWRIEKFKVVDWPTDQMGKFYNGDSYILLHSYQLGANKPLKHDIHFWLGENTSQDEAGTAAYKTVELDDRLGRAAVQHREVQSHESSLFLQYFPEYTIEILEGGIDSGFNHVEAKKYNARLLQVKGTNNNIRVTQVPMARDSLNSGDCFILDFGMEIMQWNGKKSSLYEKMRAGQVVRAMRDERGGKPEAAIYTEGDTDSDLDKFWEALGGKGPVKSAEEGGNDADAAEQMQDQVKLFRLSDKSGSMKFTLEKTGDLTKSDLDTNDTFVLDNGAEVFCWIGKKASKEERSKGMQYAQKYLSDYNRPAYLPISRVVEGGESAVFDLNFGGGMLTRDIDFNAPASGGRAPCCPHHGGERSMASALLMGAAKNSLASKFGGKNSGKQQQQQQGSELEQAASQVFSIFRNKFKF